MRAQNLTISIPYEGCDKNCPYCISKITGYTKANAELMRRNVKKVLTLALSAGVNSVLLTGKGEPILNYHDLMYFVDVFYDFPIDIQTNGVWLNNNTKEREETLRDLARSGVNTIAFSIDNLHTIKKYTPLFGEIKDKGMLVRVCINVTKSINSPFCTIMGLIRDTAAVDQLLVRNISYPSTADRSNKAVRWIDEHVDIKQYYDLYEEFFEEVDENSDLIRVLPDGVKVYDFDDIAVCFSDYCIQESNRDDHIISLIFL